MGGGEGGGGGTTLGGVRASPSAAPLICSRLAQTCTLSSSVSSSGAWLRLRRVVFASVYSRTTEAIRTGMACRWVGWVGAVGVSPMMQLN